METKASSDIQLLPGFRFHPSDEELIVHYLKNKVISSPLPASIIADIDLYKYNPWELPRKALFGEDEWYFFTPRDRKYPNGARPNRAAASGYWKATGTDKPILASCGTTNIGVKKALVFYKGRPPKGIKTDWIMQEYRLLDSIIWNNPKQKASMRLDDWVLCRVRQKNSIARNIWEERDVPSSEPPDLYPEVTELLQTNTNHNIDMVNNYLYNSYPMLPYTFAPQNFSCTERASSISFQSSDKSCNSLDNLITPLKRKFAERNEQRGNYIQLGKNLRTKEDTEEESSISIRNDGTNVNFCGPNQSGVTTFIPGQWNSLARYQEFN